MPRPTTRAKFTTESLSRSASLEREGQIDEQRSRAGQRTGSFSSPSRSQDVDVPAQIYEEEPFSEDVPSERDPFLAGDSMENGNSNGHGEVADTSKAARAKRAMSYNTFGDGTQTRFLQLLDAPRGLTRNESIFRLSGLIDDKGGQYEKYRKSEEELRAIKSKKIRTFYEEQNATLDYFLEVDEILENVTALAQTGQLAPLIPSKPSAGKAEAHNVKVTLAINVNFALNAVLLIAKIVIVVLSSSISLLASTVDSAMDFLSTLIIFTTSRVIQHRSWRSLYYFPTGKQRMEPLGVCIFAVFMISSFLQVLIESLQRLFDKNLQVAAIPLIGKVVMIATIVIKGFVWLWCRTIRSTSVDALTQDAENDIVFNTFSLLFPFVGEQLGWKYLDPIGGIVLSIYIVSEWAHTLLDNVNKLTGRRASASEHQRVAYLVSRFSPLIRGIQHLSVYHAGDSVIVEVDIVLSPTTDLTVAHNIGESAQYGLEQLEGVDRAFVHLDVSVNPLSGHVIR